MRIEIFCLHKHITLLRILHLFYCLAALTFYVSALPDILTANSLMLPLSMSIFIELCIMVIHLFVQLYMNRFLHQVMQYIFDMSRV